VAAAEPAVDAEQLDAIRLAPEDAFSRRGDAEREPREFLPVAERRRHRQRLAILRL
jgi:hypothetical protein